MQPPLPSVEIRVPTRFSRTVQAKDVNGALVRIHAPRRAEAVDGLIQRFDAEVIRPCS